MPRQNRVEIPGFYHIVNRGVAKSDIFLDDNDHLKFLDILQEASLDYDFEIFSYCLMDNHYHLLINIKHKNLSLLMQKINSRYSIYFNNKYKRVGPLWQGRFKSWYVYDEAYLQALVKYVEFNPIKAGMVNKIYEFKWSMSSRNIVLGCMNYELIDTVSFGKDLSLSSDELQSIGKIFKAKFNICEDKTIQLEKKKNIEYYFSKYSKEDAIFIALQDGYKQSEIAKFLKLSNVYISKIVKTYKQKLGLFNKLRDRGIFWSYSKNITYKDDTKNLLIEYLLKYGDFDDIVLGFKLFGKRVIRKVWEEKLQSDKRFTFKDSFKHC